MSQNYKKKGALEFNPCSFTNRFKLEKTLFSTPWLYNPAKSILWQWEKLVWLNHVLLLLAVHIVYHSGDIARTFPLKVLFYII